MAVNPLIDVKSDLVDVTGPSGGGTPVTNVTGSAPISSSGGTTPNISLSTPLAPNYGGTGIDLTGAGTGYVKSTAGTVTVEAVPIQVSEGGTSAATFSAGYVKSPGGTGALVTQAVPIPISDGGTNLTAVPAAGYVKSTGAAYTSQAVPIPVTDGGTGTVTAFTQGAVPFAGASGVYSQDPTNLWWDATNHRFGLGTNSPNLLLDINGPYASRGAAITNLVNGLNSNITLPASSYVRLSGPTGAYSVGGFTGGTDGRQLAIYNTINQTLTLKNEDNLSTAANRIKTLTGADVVLASGLTSSALFTYDATDQRWIYQQAVSVSGGYLLANGSTPLTANWNASAGQTTTPYYIQSRNSTDWYNVLAYGADNTGATDTTTAVQAAITACSSGGGGVVYFPQGTYKIASTLNVSSTGMIFQGDGREGNAQITNSSTLLLPTASDGFNITQTNATPVQFRDLSFDTTTQAAGTAGAFIHANATGTSFPLLVERCKFWHHFVGIQMNTCKIANINYNHFNNGAATGNDIWVNNTNIVDEGDNRYIGNIFSTANSANFRLTAGGGEYIAYNKFIGNPTYQILLDIANGNATADLLIHGNSMEGTPTTATIALLAAGRYQNIHIQDNQFDIAAGLNCILIQPTATGQLSRGLITGNDFWGGASHIVMSPGQAAGMSNWFIGGNVYDSPTTAAITLPATANRVQYLRIAPGNFIQSGTAPYISGAFDSTSGLTPGIETVFSQTANSTTTANSATTVFGSGNGSLTIPAGRLMQGTVIRFFVGGYQSTADGGSAAHVITLKLGGVTVVTFTSPAYTGALNSGFSFNAEIVCRSVGSSGTVWSFSPSIGYVQGSANYYLNSTAAATVNTTTALTLDLTYNNGNATGALTTTAATVELLDARPVG